MMPFRSNSRAVAFVSTLLFVSLAGPVQAHCDSMDGPVVADAQRALSQKSVEPGIAVADQALATGEIEPLADELAEAVRAAVMDRFQAASSARQTAEDSVEEGRKFVEGYVQFTHFVEQADHLVAEGARHQHRENLETQLNVWSKP